MPIYRDKLLCLFTEIARAPKLCARFRREQEPVNFVLFRVAKKKKNKLKEVVVYTKVPAIYGDNVLCKLTIRSNLQIINSV